MLIAEQKSAEIQAFQDVLNIGDLGVALDFLNERTGYRFTVVYKSEPPLAKRIYVHDRDADYTPGLDRVLVEDSFFALMVPVFTSADAVQDPRCQLLRSSRLFLGVCGVQLFYADGRHYGWLAHGSPHAMPVPEGEIEFLQQAAPFLMQVVEVLPAGDDCLPERVSGHAPLA